MSKVKDEKLFFFDLNDIFDKDIIKNCLEYSLEYSKKNDIESVLYGYADIVNDEVKNEHTALWRIMLDSNIVKNNELLFYTNLSLGEDTKFINTYFLFQHLQEI